MAFILSILDMFSNVAPSHTILPPSAGRKGAKLQAKPTTLDSGREDVGPVDASISPSLLRSVPSLARCNGINDSIVASPSTHQRHGI
ncbi:unnamed protein product [Arctogadus glacialis]